MSGRVVVVGSVNVDLVVKTSRLPAPGETVPGGEFRRFDGGKGGNQAVAAARLGAQVVLIAAVGDDADGADACLALEREGIATDGIVPLAESPTGVALIMVDDAGENLIAVAPGANARLTEALVEAAFEHFGLRADDVLLVGHEIPTATARTAMRIGRQSGAVTIFNPAPADGLDLDTLALADVLTPNALELASLVADSAEDPSEAARRLLGALQGGRDPTQAVLVSLGRAGAVLVRSSGPAVEIAAPPVTTVDATGAGDTLNGALAARLAAGVDLDAAARFAVVAASLSVTRAGAREGMRTLAEIAVFSG
ncbi:MAG: ribokinase [Chloroflexota bacterium]|nr:ribokinase [Chloroflexota bacterium]